MLKNLTSKTKENVCKKIVVGLLIIALTFVNLVILAEVAGKITAAITVTSITDIDMYLTENKETQPVKVEESPKEPVYTELNTRILKGEEMPTVSETPARIGLEMSCNQENSVVVNQTELTYNIKVNNFNIDEEGNLIENGKTEEQISYDEWMNTYMPELERLYGELAQYDEFEEIVDQETIEKIESLIEQIEEIEKNMPEEPKIPEEGELGIKNIVVKGILPQGVTYKQAGIHGYNEEGKEYKTDKVTFNSETREVVWNVGGLTYIDSIDVDLVVTIDDMPNGTEIVNSLTATYEGSNLIKSNEIKVTVAKAEVKTNKIDIIENNGRVQVKAFITNSGLVEMENFEAKLEIPEGLIPEEISYGYVANQETGKEENITTMSFNETSIVFPIVNLEAGETYLISAVINPKGLDPKGNEDTKAIEVSLSVTGSNKMVWEITAVKAENLAGNPNKDGNLNENGNGQTGNNGNEQNGSNPNGTGNENNNSENNKEGTLGNSALGYNLKLDKYVSKIVVQNQEGVQTYNFSNEKLAKVDIKSKYLNETTILIEYKMVVTNIGNKEMIAVRISDNIPSGMEFPSELNPSWVYTDGALKTEELKSIEIKPGETKEVTLVLRKRLTESNIGVIKNTALIEAVNQEETNINDNRSSAEAIISIETGIEESVMMAVAVNIILGISLYKNMKESI